MSIRLRTVNGIRIAICAARSVEKPGDLYLDDSDHHALMAKFRRDDAEERSGGKPHLVKSDADDLLVEREESNNSAREEWDKQWKGVP